MRALLAFIALLPAFAFADLLITTNADTQICLPDGAYIAQTGPGLCDQEPNEPTPHPNEPADPNGPTYTQLEALTANTKFLGYPMPAYESPEDGWAMIEAECGPVGSWDHEIVLPYQVEPYHADTVKVKDLAGCVHVKGELGPNGEKPKIDGYINATHGYNGGAPAGGVFVENLEANAVGSPNNKKFLVMRNLLLHDWTGHALITSGSNRHMYVEILDSWAHTGHNNHAFYIDNVAFANVQRNRVESPGMGHSLRIVASRSVVKDNLLCSVYCDGTTRKKPNGSDFVGMPPLEVYVNGSHEVDGNEVRYFRRTANAAPMASTYRNRESFNVLDRRLSDDGTHYDPLVWGTPEFNDAGTWQFPMLDTVVRNHKTVCQGEPCYAWDVKSTYPYLHDRPKTRLQAWWKENCFPDWQTLLDNADPSWHGTLDLMSQPWKDTYIEKCGRGLPNKVPFPVPDAWQQKARITFESLTGENMAGIVRPRDYDGWCAGEIENGECVNQEAYLQADIVFADGPVEPDPNQPVADWIDSLEPHIPATARTVSLIPDSAMNVLLPDDNTAVCFYLGCFNSDVALRVWTGMAWDQENGCAWFIAPGGHGDLGANSVYRYCFGKGWDRLYDYGQPSTIDTCGPLQDGPPAAHGYDSVVWVPTRNMAMKLGAGGFQPNGMVDNCGISTESVWGWDGQWHELAPLFYRFARTAYDPKRDVVWFAQQNGTSGLFSMNPHTMEVTLHQKLWTGKGGAMDVQGDLLCWSAPAKGVYCADIVNDAPTNIRQLTTENQIANTSWGLAISGRTVVTWDGKQTFAHTDADTGETEVFEAGGDVVPDSGGVDRVYGKFVNVSPGVFAGISDTYGWIVYRAF